MSPTTQARRARTTAVAVTMLVFAALFAATSAAAWAAPAVATHGTLTAALQTGPAPVIRVDRAGLTYKLPSGTEVTLARTGPQFHFPSGAIHFVSRDVITTSTGTDYAMSIAATRLLGGNQGDTDLFIVLQRTQLGPTTAALQFHGYDFTLPKDGLQFSKTGPKALLSTGSALADFGGVKLLFAPQGNPTASCHGENERWQGTSSGTVSFTPQGDNGFFGTITGSSFAHAALTVAHGCVGLLGPSAVAGKTPPCPQPTFDVDGAYGTQTRFSEVLAMPDPESGGADQFATFQVARDPAISIHEIQAIVPRGGVTQGPKRTATIRAYANTFLTGIADYRSKGQAAVDGPYPCQGGQIVFKSTFGPFTGEPSNPFTAQFDTGPMVVPSDDQNAFGGELDRVIVK